jgi:hypothetical protein
MRVFQGDLLSCFLDAFDAVKRVKILYYIIIIRLHIVGTDVSSTFISKLYWYYQENNHSTASIGGMIWSVGSCPCVDD